MKRQLEPEIMDQEEQVRAYAQADFSKENEWFVRQFFEQFPEMTEGVILDLGCGPADIPIRLVHTSPNLTVIAVDASALMIQYAQSAVNAAGLGASIHLVHSRFQDLKLDQPVDAILSNSLVHHVPNPLQFWHALRFLGKPGAPVFIMDLYRPESIEEAQALVDLYAANESEQLRHDFYHSLLAAFTEDEVAAHLAEMNLTRLLIDVPDDQHWVVAGRL